ncbi:uncharacterized protein LOC124881778 isoform X2 [Girardinichthys multiradiatus]|uniref:uncharacterized protein LOC124881778 isoform X2 n=1 Tax=Girardinichthys multiradiatus TaxID=208333 RepID=UPI001FAD456B|nr:uncharacterized protein LOC124881778 isoform X2 [Girardinichthys multiradiatus]
MRLFLSVSVFLALGLNLPERVSLSGLPEDLEGSAYDLDGSGSGFDPDQGTNNKPGPATVSDPGKENTNTAKKSSNLNVGGSDRHVTVSEMVFISNSKSLLENKEVAAAATAGGITGATIGILLSAILIYKWRKKHKEECIFSQKGASDEDYHKSSREVVFI